ncbi:hypothetical protein HZA96_06350 [Candidatus Woesearchaeota archaeon]|nr:hypothetical protein [Candidatus Woesearchaeota archaeon]
MVNLFELFRRREKEQPSAPARQELYAPSIQEVITSSQKVNPSDDLETKIGVEVMNMFASNTFFASDYLLLQMLLNDREEFASEALALYTTTVSVALSNPELSTILSDADNPFFSYPFLDSLQGPLHIANNMKQNSSLKNPRIVYEQKQFEGKDGKYIKATLEAIQRDNYKGNYNGIIHKFARIFLDEKGVSWGLFQLDIKKEKTFAYNLGHDIMEKLETGKFSEFL